MAHKKLSRLKSLAPDLTSRLAAKGIITCKDFLSANILQLMDVMEVTYPQLQLLQASVSSACVPSSTTVLMMQQAGVSNGRRFLSTSIDELDSILKGGLAPKTVTEISGPSGCGKTQFCLMLSVVAALPRALGGHGNPVVYIDTEGAFSAERLVEIATKLARTSTSSPCCTPDHDDGGEEEGREGVVINDVVRQIARDVCVYKELTCERFLKCLDALERDVAYRGVGMVLVDSVASLARKEFDVTGRKGIMERTAFLLMVSTKLKNLAESFNLNVVVTNQIYSRLSSDTQDLPGVGGSRSEMDNNDVGVVSVALGTAWYHSINTRLMLDFSREGWKFRKLTVDKSPLCGRCSILLRVSGMGLTACSHAPLDAKREERGHCDGVSYSSCGYSQLGFPFEFPGHWQ